ncbi:MAG: MlaD family protein, partial [Bacteroidales bacterium]|nr:MlaD family protein [Bacteroidales bacterium]
MKMTKEFRIGVFVVAVLAVTFFVINFLRGKDLLGREMEVRAYYDNVEGLLPSAPVYIKGYKAGAVTDVVYQPE